MKKIIILLSLLFMSVTFVWANGASEKEDEKQVIEIASNYTQVDQVELTEKIYQELVDEYNTKFGTNYELNFVFGQGMDIINTRMSSSDKPDIFAVDSPTDATRFANDGLLLDLSKYAEEYNWKEEMFSWAYNLSQVDGSVMSLPFGYEGLVIWYNKSIMKELNIDPLQIDTLAEFEDSLEKAQKANYIPIMLGSQDWPWAQEWYLSIMYSYTSRELLKETLEGTSELGWEDPRFKETVQLYKKWHDKEYLANGKSFILTSDDAINAFTTNKSLYKLEGTWAPYWILPLTQEEQDNIGVMLHPAINDVEQPHLPLAIGQNWCVSAESENADIAAYILNGMMSEKYQADFLNLGIDIAPIKLSETAFNDLPSTIKDMWNMINKALDNGSYGYATYAFYPPETRVYAYEAIVNVLEDNISIDEYLEKMQELNTKELNQGFKPIIP